jgi:ribonuclease VapC
MAYLQGEPGADAVEHLLSSRRQEHWMSVVNVGEVYYSVAKSSGMPTANEVFKDVLALPLQMVDAGFSSAMEASRLKAEHALSYADCFAAALTHRYSAKLVTGDREFESIQHLIEIEWLPSRPRRAR